MLKLFRQKKLVVKGLLFGIVLMVGAAMLVYLVPGAGCGGSLTDPQGVLAQVGDAPVTQSEVQRQYERAAQQYGTQSEQFRRLILEQVVQDLIGQQLVRYEAVRLGIKVSPEEVGARLRQIPQIYPGGQFVGMESYQRLVEQQFRMSVAQFEQAVEQEALLAKMFHWVTGGITVSPAEVEQEYRRRRERVEVEFTLFRAEEAGRRLAPTEKELEAFFESHRDRYRIPERRAVRFVPIDYAGLFQRVQVTPPELEAYYQSRRDLYHQPERVKVRHILWLLRKPGQPAAPAAEVRKRAEEVLAQLRRGKDFAALAGQHSDDAATRDKGGAIGWVRRGQAAPALEQAIFSLSPGAPAQLVETSYGFHLVQVLDHEPERMKSLEEVRPEIEPVLKADKVRQVGLDQARQIAAAVGAGRKLEEAAREAGWTLVETPLFKRDEALPGLTGSREFQEAAFRLPAESAGQPRAPVSGPVEVPAGYTVMQLKEVAAERPASFEEVRQDVERAWRQAQGAEQAREAAHRLAEQVKAGQSLREGAGRLGAEVRTSGKFGRDGFLPELGAARDVAPVAFGLPVGGVSPAFPVGGNWVVLRVLGREEADLGQLTDDERKTIRAALLGGKRGLAWEVFRENLKKKMLAEGTLVVNQKAIDRLTGKS
ncbi:MAG: peptidyl-prolyl cis-trans isomerase [Acidobacteria bacterium]|nr:peptidyl-prolyl cis-trans isomerase [Acidobacteriota bacterium]